MRLCQIIAIEKGVKAHVNKRSGELHKQNQNQDAFYGMHRTYLPLDDEDPEVMPEESKRVVADALDNLGEQSDLLKDLWAVILTKDGANCVANASIRIDGKMVVSDVPVTTLLFLEKQLLDLKTFIERLPVLDASHAWKESEAGGFATEPVQTHRTKRVKNAITLAQATEHHPAQCALVDEDRVVGHWAKTIFSRALRPSRRRELLERCLKALKAVKQAREEANTITIDGRDLNSLVDYIVEGGASK